MLPSPRQVSYIQTTPPFPFHWMEEQEAVGAPSNSLSTSPLDRLQVQVLLLPRSIVGSHDADL